MKARALNAAFLLCALALASYLRLAGLGVPSFWLDEILGYDSATAAARQPFWRWLAIFDPEHGPLYYATELAGRVVHHVEFSARVAPALFGMVTILVGWYAARAIAGRRATPYVFVLLLAASPLLVYYSREARPYALVVLVSTALLAAFLWRKRMQTVAPLLAIAFYSTAAVAPVIASAAVGAAFNRWWKQAATALACACLFALCYHPTRDLAASRADWSIFRGLLNSFSVAAVDTTRAHRAAYVFAILALIGAIDLMRRDRTQAIIAISLALLPVAIAIAGAFAMRHFFAVRYVIGALPAYLLLVSVGVATILAPLQRWRVEVAASILAALILVHQGWDAAVNEPYRKLDWRAIATAIGRHAHAGDPVITANDASLIAIGFYLRGVSPPVRVFNAGSSPTMGEVFAFQSTTSWIVVSGYDGAFADWACRFPVVLASPLENFRLHYSPTPYYFLTDRSTPAEHRALVASFGGDPLLQLGPGDDDLLGDGWGGAESDGGRRVIGRRAYVALPLRDPVDRVINVEIESVPQTMTIFVNDQPAGGIALSDGRRRYAFNAQSALWRAGINNLRLELDRSQPARVFEIGIGPLTPSLSPQRGDRVQGEGHDAAHHVRLADVALDVPGERGRTLSPDVDFGKLAQLVGRLGFDPDFVIPKLVSGQTTLANLAGSLADDSVCIDDRKFVGIVIPALLNRSISDREMRTWSRLRAGSTSRRTLAWRLANSDEVRASIAGVR